MNLERRNLAQILNDAKIDYYREYQRLYAMFYEITLNSYGNTLRDHCSERFDYIPFRGTCICLDDFEDFYNIKFEKIPRTSI